jgi:hypothetical protein
MYHTQFCVAVSTEELVQCLSDDDGIEVTMNSEHDIHVVELRLSYRYVNEHPWVVAAVNGFLSAYFMEQPSFRVQRHFDELESGMHVWLCETPSTMKIGSLLRRLQADIPPCRYSQTETEPTTRPQYVIDFPEKS